MASTLSRLQGSRVQVIGAGDAYATLAGTTESAGTLSVSSQVGANITCEVVSDASPTDDVNFTVYSAHSELELYDTVGMSSVRIDTGAAGTTATHQKTIILHGQMPDSLKVGAVQTGSTDTHDVRVYVKPWKITSS